MQDLSDEVIQLQNSLSEVQARLSCWTDPDSVNDIQVLTQMEDSVKESIQRIRRQKENLANQHFVRVDSINNQLHNDIELPFQGSEDLHIQDLSTWIPFDEMQHFAVPGEINLHSQRDVGCSSGQSFTGPFNYYNTALSCLQPSQEDSYGAHLPQQIPLTLDGQYPYHCSFNTVGDDRSFQQLLGMDVKPNLVDYGIDGRFQPPPVPARNGASTSTSHVLPMSCGDYIFTDHLNSQKGARVPSPMAPTIYKAVVNDPNRSLYDLLNAPN